MAKMNRERKVREKRALKLEKKQAVKAAREAEAVGLSAAGPVADGPAEDDPLAGPSDGTGVRPEDREDGSELRPAT